MPELPELEVFTGNITRRLGGKTVSRAEYHKEKRLNVTPDALNAAVAGQTLTKAAREGKESVLVFGDDTRVGIHLMLKGEFHITDDPASVKYKVLTVHFDDGQALVAGDSMALMTVTLDPPAFTGLDAPDVTVESLKTLIRRKPSQPIKVLLMDQDLICGIGNAYADEILYEAGIAPHSIAGRLPDAALEALSQRIPAVLRDGIEEIRKSHPEALGGEYRHFMKIHAVKAGVCPAGSPILTDEINKRKTYYTERQVRYV
jgi:formamidopyrimidine-DNA glycosylase